MEEISNIIWVVAAEALDNYMLRLTFNNGRVKTFDCKPLIQQSPVFGPLQNKEIFHNITLDGWTVTWKNGSIDIVPEYLYEKGVSVYEPQETTENLVAEDNSPYNPEQLYLKQNLRLRLKTLEDTSRAEAQNLKSPTLRSLRSLVWGFFEKIVFLRHE